MNEEERCYLLAERTSLERMLASLPESSVIDRMSLEARKEKVEEELATMNGAPKQHVFRCKFCGTELHCPQEAGRLCGLESRSSTDAQDPKYVARLNGWTSIREPEADVWCCYGCRLRAAVHALDIVGWGTAS